MRLLLDIFSDVDKINHRTITKILPRLLYSLYRGTHMPSPEGKLMIAQDLQGTLLSRLNI